MTAGTVNTGGGGGGFGNTSSSGAAGGSGIVIIQYSSPAQRSFSGVVTSYSSGGNTFWVHTFTSSGIFIA
jgi:hypothetical protein